MLPFIDLKAQYRRIEDDIKARVSAVLEHGAYIMGPEVNELEEKLAGYMGVKHVVSCSSGTDALLMPLMAWGIKPGDAVFVPTFTFFATVEMVALLGATPVFVEVDPVTFNMEPEALKLAVEALRQKDPAKYPLPKNYREISAKAVIPVDLFGIAANYAEIVPIAKANNLLLLEDAAQAFGARAGNSVSGNMGCDAAAFSFFPAKPLGGYGDSGAIATNDDNLASLLKSIRVHGQGRDKYENIRIGLNGRMDTLQAAVLLAKLAIFDNEVKARQKVAERYNQQLGGLPGVVVPSVPPAHVSVWAQYSILLPRRDQVSEALKEAGIPTNIYYSMSLHQQASMAYLGYVDQCFPVTRDLSKRILSLPMHPYLEEAEQDKICRALADAL